MNRPHTALSGGSSDLESSVDLTGLPGSLDSLYSSGAFKDAKVIPGDNFYPPILRVSREAHTGDEGMIIVNRDLL